MGLRRVAGGDRKTYIEAFTDMVEELALSIGGELEQRKAELIFPIKSTFSAQQMGYLMKALNR